MLDFERYGSALDNVGVDLVGDRWTYILRPRRETF